MEMEMRKATTTKGLPTPELASLEPADLAMLVASLDALPALSSTVVRLLDMFQGARPTPAEVASLLGTDAALAAKVLALANSSRFGLRRSVTSIEHAASLIGVQRVFEIALAAGMASVLPDRLPGYGQDTKDLSLHNAATAVFAETMAPHASSCTPGNAFVAGLLHDVGKLAFCTLVSNRWVEVAAKMARGGLTLVEAEREVLGVGHPEVGQIILNSWDLPKDLGLVARYHHEPKDAPDAVQATAGVVNIASGLAHSFGLGADLAGLCRELDETLRSELGLTRSVVEKCVLDAMPRVLDIAGVMVG